MSSAGNEVGFDGATGVSLGELVLNHETTIDQHSGLIQSLSTSTSAMFKQISTLTERVNQMASLPSAPPAASNTVHSSVPDRALSSISRTLFRRFWFLSGFIGSGFPSV